MMVLTACGTGISTDPRLDPSGGVGGDRDARDDLSTSDSGADTDGPTSESATDFDATADESLGPGGEAGGNDAAVDLRRDVASDDAADRSSDGIIDVFGDVSADRADHATARPDVSIDAAADSRDAPPPPNDATFDGVETAGDADAADRCSVGCDTETDCYVDANAATAGDGSKQAPFKTIGACIEAHTRSPGRARTAHIAAGTYDESMGEHFPLVLRGLSLEGAGADQTFIRGSGLFDHSAEQGTKNSVYLVTMVVGDRVLPTHLSGFSVRPVPLVPTYDYHGVFCDRGNATGEVPSPGGQTFIDRIKAGPGFDTAVLAVTSTLPSVTGCNLVVTHSTFTGGWMGIDSTACEDGVPPGHVVLEVGNDDPTSGNAFSWMQAQEWLGFGVRVGACAILTSLQYNSFSDSVVGAEIGGEGPTPNGRPLVVRHNTFDRLSETGLRVGWGAIIEEVSDNRFSAVARPSTSAGAMVFLTPSIGKVRRNVIAGGDVGLMIWPGVESIDFGRADDPGGNVFYCNSGGDATAYVTGGDVLYYPSLPRSLAPDPDGGAPPTLHFAGNFWDHLPPRTGDLSAPDGTEFRLDPAWPVQLDVSNASLVTTPCPPGRIR